MEERGGKVSRKSESIKRRRTHGRDREKIFAQALYDRGLLPELHKELLKLNNKEMNNPVKK